MEKSLWNTFNNNNMDVVYTDYVDNILKKTM